MKKILITGAGGTPSTNFIRSLRDAPEEFHLVGVDCNRFYLQRAETNERFLVPAANESDYVDVINAVIEKTKAEFLHAQPDEEVFTISKNRDKIEAATFLPKHSTIETCQNKYKSFVAWKNAGIKVPETILITDESELMRAFNEFGDKIWIREIRGAFGKGSLLATNYKMAKSWVDFKRGWGSYTAAEYLSPQSITWLSLWKGGELIVAQGRKRIYWEFANRSPSGITGITGTGITVSDATLDRIAQESIYAIDKEPDGIFGVDLTYDRDETPNPTEINIGRFFTTHYFFTKAGLNMPYIYVQLAYNEKIPKISKKINPLQDGWCWIRGMDVEPTLVRVEEIERFELDLRFLRANISAKSER